MSCQLISIKLSKQYYSLRETLGWSILHFSRNRKVWIDTSTYIDCLKNILPLPFLLSQFVDACFGPFAAQLSVKAEPYKELEKEAADLISCLHEKLERRRRGLQTGLSTNVRSKVKLTTIELKVRDIIFLLL